MIYFRTTPKESYSVFRTQAFQIGVLMAFSYLKYQLKIVEPDQTLAAVNSWIDAWNETYTREISGKHRGLYAYDRNHNSGSAGAGEHRTLMGIQPVRLQVGEWYWIRYFVFEQMAASKIEFIGKAEVAAVLPELRQKFLLRLAKSIRKQADQIGTPLTADEAHVRAEERWGDALKYCFGVTKESYRASLRPLPAGVREPVADTTSMPGDADDDDSSGADE